MKLTIDSPVNGAGGLTSAIVSVAGSGTVGGAGSATGGKTGAGAGGAGIGAGRGAGNKTGPGGGGSDNGAGAGTTIDNAVGFNGVETDDGAGVFKCKVSNNSPKFIIGDVGVLFRSSCPKGSKSGDLKESDSSVSDKIGWDLVCNVVFEGGAIEGCFL